MLALFPDFEDISVNAYEVRQETKDRLGFFGATVSPEGADAFEAMAFLSISEMSCTK